MNYILANFASRNETLAFVRLLRSSGLAAEIINTPASAGGGCSISAKLPYGALAMAQRVLSNSHLTSFRGFFVLYYQNGRQIATPI